RALKEGSVKPDGIELTVLTDMTSDIRHWRMIRNQEFDIGELSMSNFLMARYTGLPFMAIPVFLHRRFRHGFAFLNAAKGITKPAELRGKRGGLANFGAPRNLGDPGYLREGVGCASWADQMFKAGERRGGGAPAGRLEDSRGPRR